jgi:hypothetical protein
MRHAADHQEHVIPAEAGIQGLAARAARVFWAPACAGVTRSMR